MAKFTTKTVEVEAMQWDGRSIEAALEFMRPPGRPKGYADPSLFYVPATGELSWTGNGAEDGEGVLPGDWIIKRNAQVYGRPNEDFVAEFSPCP